MNNTVKANRLVDLDLDLLTIDGNLNANGNINIRYDHNNLVFQTPYMNVYGDLRQTSFEGVYQLDTLFTGDTSSKNRMFFDFIEQLEAKLTDYIARHGSGWFDNNCVNIKSLIRESSENNYYIKWPIYLNKDIFVDENRRKISPDNITKSTCVKLIVEIPGIWRKSSECGLALVVRKVLVKQRYSDYEFNLSDEHSDNQDIISFLATEQITKPVTTNVTDDVAVVAVENDSLVNENNGVSEECVNEHSSSDGGSSTWNDDY